MRIPFPKPAIIRNDNLTAQGIAKGEAKLQRTKHIDTKYHFIREAIQLGIVDLIHVPREINISDMFTHPLGASLHKSQSAIVMNEKQVETNDSVVQKALRTIAVNQKNSPDACDYLQTKMQSLSIEAKPCLSMSPHRIAMAA